MKWEKWERLIFMSRHYLCKWENLVCLASLFVPKIAHTLHLIYTKKKSKPRTTTTNPWKRTGIAGQVSWLEFPQFWFQICLNFPFQETLNMRKHSQLSELMCICMCILYIYKNICTYTVLTLAFPYSNGKAHTHHIFGSCDCALKSIQKTKPLSELRFQCKGLQIHVSFASFVPICRDLSLKSQVKLRKQHS